MTTTDRKILLIFLVLSLVLRLACLNLNAAEYTDGILQITAFDYGFTFWPPAYTVAVKALAPLAGELERAAKLISMLSSTLLLLPLYGLTRRLAGRRAAVYASLFYLTDPIAVRWGIRVMSDSLFNLLFFWSAALFLKVMEDAAAEPNEGTGGPQSTPGLAGLVCGGILAPIATLTRYQGILLLPLELLALRAFLRRRGQREVSGGSLGQVANLSYARGWGRAAGLLLPWAAVAGWILSHSGGHEQQIAERAGQTLLGALLNYWLLGESFVLVFPYFITIPAFVLAVTGLGLFFAAKSVERRVGWTFIFFAVCILAMQSVFASFQERYLLPLVPFLMTFAGGAAARWEESARAWRPAVRSALIASLVFSAAFSCAVLALQRGAFGDLKEAARYCGTALPREARVYSNEYFKPNMPAIKLSFWSGRKVEGLDAAPRLAKGDYVCLHSSYGGLSPYPALRPSARFAEQLAELRARYDCRELAWFQSRLVPLLPDIMENPDTHQNPVAWFYRYAPQQFRTVILRIEGTKAAR